MSENLLPYLHQTFPGSEAITTAEFRDFLKISPSTARRMRLIGQYPKTISLPGQTGEKRILLVDLAAWLERGGCLPDAPKKRGRPAGSRNRPKKD